MTMKSNLRAAIVAALAVGVAGAAGAQQARNEQGGQPQAANAQTEPSDDAGREAREEFERTVGYEQYLSGSDLRASELVGATVRNQEGEVLGDIEDLIVSRDDDVITAVISVGGFLNIGDKLVGVPYEELRVAESGDVLYLAATEEELESRPTFEYEERPGGADELDNRPRQQADRDEQQPDRAGPEAGLQRQQQAGQDRDQPGIADSQARDSAASQADADDGNVRAADDSNAEDDNIETMAADTHRASDLIGSTVVDSQGEDVGEVDDLIVSADGRIEAVLSLGGGILGIGDRLVRVPIEELEFDNAGDADGAEEEGQVRIMSSAEQLMERNPEFRYELQAAATDR